MKCTNCGAELPEGSTVCFECGAPQQSPAATPTPDTTAQNSTPVNTAPTVKCINCGAEIAEGSTVCFECGAPQNVAKTTPTATPTQTPNATPVTNMGKAKSKVLAAILAILWGSYGIDQFYLGYVKKGFIRIIVTVVTCFIGGVIWGIVDGVKILNGTINTDANGNPII